MRKDAQTPTTTDRRRFAFEKAGELWMSDVMHAPAVTTAARRKHKTYLIAFLDDATRVVPFSTFALSENTAAFLPVFQQAILRRGLPARLYVDNGANYRSHHLALVCAKLGVALIHARPYQPQGKDYASHCTSFERFDATSGKRRLWESFWPILFTGGWSPGCSYKHSFLSLYA
jgi:transposase InsO family protein